jgi:pimeloyl-ACP methyl ester carboxylesterase
MSMIEVEPGLALHVQDVGEGRPVVLLAGFGLDHAVWDEQVRVLAADHRVVCIDLRGTGGSAKPYAGYDIDRLVADVLAVLEHLDLREVTLVGWSFGGQISFRLTALHPERVAQLVLVGSNGVRASRSEAFPFGGPADVLEQQLVGAERADRLKARRETMISGFGAPPRPDVLDFLVSRSLQMPSWAAVACFATYLHTDSVELVDRIRVPVLQVRGGADPVHSPRGAAWLQEQLPGGRLVELADCGHYPMFEAAGAFTDALRSFVAEADRDAGGRYAA